MTRLTKHKKYRTGNTEIAKRNWLKMNVYLGEAIDKLALLEDQLDTEGIIMIKHESFIEEIRRITNDNINSNQQRLAEYVIERLKKEIRYAAAQGKNKIQFQLKSDDEVSSVDLIVKKAQELGLVCEYKHAEADLHEPLSYNQDYIVISW